MRIMSIDISGIADAVAYAVEDLSKKLGMARDDIIVVESGEAMWPDSSLGMPEHGKMYAQMLTEGFRVVLEAGGKTYEYHFGNGTVKAR
jgi:hypothetical protein